MGRSLRLLVLGVVVPGALTPLVYRGLTSRDDASVRVETFHRVEARSVGRASTPRMRGHAHRPERPRRPEPPMRPERPHRVAMATMVVDACRHELEERFDARAGGGMALDVDAGSGSLRVEGVSGLQSVQVVARACASEAEWLAELGTRVVGEGERVSVRTSYPEWGNGWSENRYARIDLIVRVPLGMRASVRDGSGDAWIGGTGDLDVEDSSGHLEIRGVDGAVRVHDSSGDLRLIDIGGDVEVEDGSGGVEIAGVRGSVTVVDGSGSLEVSDVVGNVHVPRDGSGSIRVREVGGSLVVERDGSGDVRWSGVAGDVRVPRRK